MDVHLRPRLIQPKPHHLETPESYFRRLCVANVIDHAWLAGVINRGSVDNATTLIEAIAALGGPGPAHWERARLFASVGMGTGVGNIEKPPRPRFACRRCTAGERVKTYPHVRFFFCRKHGTWLGGSCVQRPGVLTPEMWKAERLARRLVATRQADERLMEVAWELVREHSFLLDLRERDERVSAVRELPDYVAADDDRLSLFPATIRVLWTITRPDFLDDVRSGVYDLGMSRRRLRKALDPDFY